MQNTILGIVLFEAYEYSIAQLENRTKTFRDGKKELSTSLDSNLNHKDKANIELLENRYLITSNYFVAGGIAGSIYGILSTGIEKLASSSIFTFDNVAANLETKAPPFLSSSMKSIGHHSISYSSLFGSYELFKQTFFSLLRSHEYHDSTIILDNKMNKDDNRNDIDSIHQYGDWNHIAVTTAAGGIAGSIQCIISHYSEGMQKNMHSTTPTSITMDGQNSTSNHKIQNRRNITRLKSTFQKLPPAPSLRAIIMAFPSSAIGFIAFEYGKDLSSNINP